MLDILAAICWERAVLLAFRFAVLLYVVLIVCISLPFYVSGRSPKGDGIKI